MNHSKARALLNGSKRLYSSKTSSIDKSKFVPKSGTYPWGFRVGSKHVGVKKSDDPDLSLLVSEMPCSASGVFTRNVFKAAPVQVSAKVLSESEGEGIRAVVTNSGCANAVTGEGGLKDAWLMAKTTDQILESNDKKLESSTLVMSTGVIGQRLPITKIVEGIKTLEPTLGDSHESWLEFAKGICTTDTFPKLISREFDIESSTYRIAGIAKGAGMIHPNMGTLLATIVTDAPVEPLALQKVLKYAVDRSFNSISVDGDTSTNDTLLLLANGTGGGSEIRANDEKCLGEFQKVVTEVAQDLAKLIVRDGEGATKFITIKVEDALSEEDARKVASTIATSPLVKTALYGKDANWGRILCAIGYSNVAVDPFRTSVSFIPQDGSAELKLLVDGEPQEVDEERASEILQPTDVEIKVNIGTGGGKSATFWTCDFSHEYVTINGDYRS